jgi:hypothetical protein
MDIRNWKFISNHKDFNSADLARKAQSNPDDFILHRVRFWQNGKKISNWRLMKWK